MQPAGTSGMHALPLSSPAHRIPHGQSASALQIPLQTRVDSDSTHLPLAQESLSRHTLP